MFVHKCDYQGHRKVTYRGDMIARHNSERHTGDGNDHRHERSVTVRAEWTFPTQMLPYVTLTKGDVFIETYYDDRWYNVFEVRAEDGQLKGWYANITRPSRISLAPEPALEPVSDIEWDDLALDIWMSPDGVALVLDEDEFEELLPHLPGIEAASARGAIPEMQAELSRRWREYANDCIAAALKRQDWTIGTAESCTGGLIADVLTNRAGSSDYFMGGIISYNNKVKHKVLGVSEETLETQGAVSEPCALEMARGVRRALNVDVGVSATGIAGPGGGSDDKPIGLVYVGISTPESESVSRKVWPYDRIGNKQATADEALRLLMKHLM